MIEDWKWWSRNDDGFWCDVCGNLLKPQFHFDDGDEMEGYEPFVCDRRGSHDAE